MKKIILIVLIIFMFSSLSYAKFQRTVESDKVFRIEVYYTAEMEMDKVEIITDTIEKYRNEEGIVDWVIVLKEIKNYKWKK